MADRVRPRREHLGLSQAELATAAGLSRQLVGTVESGRHVPSVGAALALARVLETTVEDLFSDSVEPWEPVLDPSAENGVLMGVRVGEGLFYAPLSEVSAGSSWQRADGMFERGRVRLFPGVKPDGFAVAGCDPALGLAASLLPQRGPTRLVAIQATSAAARRALGRGRLHAAVVHGAGDALDTRKRPATRRTKLARWQVGLAARAGSDIDLGRVASGRTTVARLTSGAEAQRALERALLDHGGSAKVAGPIADGHLQSARLVAHGVAELGVVMEPAARAYGLFFRPLEEHTVFLDVDEHWTGHPGARALTELFSSKSFQTRLGAVGGYELDP
jgi:DNA-binding XRE family transcriptional regulator